MRLRLLSRSTHGRCKVSTEQLNSDSQAFVAGERDNPCRWPCFFHAAVPFNSTARKCPRLLAVPAREHAGVVWHTGQVCSATDSFVAHRVWWHVGSWAGCSALARRGTHCWQASPRYSRRHTQHWCTWFEMGPGALGQQRYSAPEEADGRAKPGDRRVRSHRASPRCWLRCTRGRGLTVRVAVSAVPGLQVAGAVGAGVWQVSADAVARVLCCPHLRFGTLCAAKTVPLEGGTDRGCRGAAECSSCDRHI